MAPVPVSARDRRVMFAMDFRDPVTGRSVTDLEVAADGLAPPIRPPSGLFVWLDSNPPAERDIKVTAKSPMKRFADFEEVIAVPAHVPNTAASSLRFSRQLSPTGLYDPPEGLTAVAGWLAEDAATKAPLSGARVSLAFRHAGTQTFISAYEAVTAANGSFVAVANDLGDVRPDPAPANGGGGLLGWLAVTRSGQTRFSGFQPLRAGRLERFAEPFLWAALNDTPP